MDQDEQVLREMLHRAAPDLGTLQPPPTLEHPKRRAPRTLIAVLASAAVVAGVAIAIAVTRPTSTPPPAAGDASTKWNVVPPSISIDGRV